jgi:hypothetical protein
MGASQGVLPIRMQQHRCYCDHITEAMAVGHFIVCFYCTLESFEFAMGLCHVRLGSGHVGLPCKSAATIKAGVCAGFRCLIEACKRMTLEPAHPASFWRQSCICFRVVVAFSRKCPMADRRDSLGFMLCYFYTFRYDRRPTRWDV